MLALWNAIIDDLEIGNQFSFVIFNVELEENHESGGNWYMTCY